MNSACVDRSWLLKRSENLQFIRGKFSPLMQRAMLRQGTQGARIQARGEGWSQDENGPRLGRTYIVLMGRRSPEQLQRRTSTAQAHYYDGLCRHHACVPL